MSEESCAVSGGYVSAGDVWEAVSAAIDEYWYVVCDGGADSAGCGVLSSYCAAEEYASADAAGDSS